MMYLYDPCILMFNSKAHQVLNIKQAFIALLRNFYIIINLLSILYRAVISTFNEAKE